MKELGVIPSHRQGRAQPGERLTPFEALRAFTVGSPTPTTWTADDRTGVDARGAAGVPPLGPAKRGQGVVRSTSPVLPLHVTLKESADGGAPVARTELNAQRASFGGGGRTTGPRSGSQPAPTSSMVAAKATPLTSRAMLV